mmetsp:Transcript_25191/g.59932  ORF Transcript_25191/g.59932 Transcript_25191/m.59932 type:complete len:150 (+) Transcript_25191:159-608(+)
MLSDAPSWIFIINADAPDGLSLRSRLNMETHDYDAMLVGAGFASLDYDDDGKKTILTTNRTSGRASFRVIMSSFLLHACPGDAPRRPEISVEQFDMSNKLHGTPIDGKERHRWHTIRIGRKDEHSVTRIINKSTSRPVDSARTLLLWRA